MKNLIYITLLLIVISCEKEIIINLEKHESRFVVNSFFAPSNSISINLSKSIQVLDTDTINYIENAKVQLFNGDALVGRMDYIGEGYYFFDTPINEKEEYTIVIDAPNLNSVTAKSEIPENIQILSLDTIHIDNRVLYAEIEFNANQEKTNYYVLELVSKYPVMEKDSVLTHQMDIIKTDIIMENGSLGDIQKRYFFSSRKISESIYAIGFAIDKETLQNSYVEGSNTIYVIFKNISEDYYYYLKSYYNLVPNLNEVYTNVSNGYGIFAGYTIAKDSIIMYHKQ